MLANKTRIRDGRGRPRKRVLEVRKAPGQARSKETVNVILEASARILESEGLRGFNTNSAAAKAGVKVENSSDTDPLVILKHFGPGNPDAEPLRKKN